MRVLPGRARGPGARSAHATPAGCPPAVKAEVRLGGGSATRRAAAAPPVTRATGPSPRRALRLAPSHHTEPLRPRCTHEAARRRAMPREDLSPPRRPLALPHHILTQTLSLPHHRAR